MQKESKELKSLKKVLDRQKKDVLYVSNWDELTWEAPKGWEEFTDSRSYSIKVPPYTHHHIFPIAITTESLFIVCPYCKKIHSHGSVALGGHRTSHCTVWGPDTGYFIDIPKELYEKEEDKST